MQIIQRYAEWNRQIIVREILKGMKWKAAEQFSVPHNYLDDSGILRKGAISAKKGDPVVIPASRNTLSVLKRIRYSRNYILYS